jgi:2-dehydropantoate 2-reductase
MNNHKKVYIVGAGAIGKALAVFLSTKGTSVVLVRASTDTTPYQKETITVATKDSSVMREIDVVTLNELSIIEGIVVIATKSFSNETVAAKLKQKLGQFSVVIMQNGLNVERPFLQLPGVFRCVLFSTSQVLDNGLISFKTVSPSPIGTVNGDPQTLARIVDALSIGEFEFRTEVDINRFAWEKTIINCAFNSLCPLLETDNGIFHRNQDALSMARSIIAEGVSLAKTYGLALNEMAIVDRLLLISKRSDGQLISTYEDLRHRRKTEIDSLNLELARLAAEIGQPQLVGVTAALGRIIEIKSAEAGEVGGH